MSSTSSIGTGTPQDSNENHPTPQDPWPSRTLGADARPEPPPVVAPDVPAQELGQAPLLTGSPPDLDHPGQAFPEGPNVAPSPWEEEAARGRS